MWEGLYTYHRGDNKKLTQVDGSSLPFEKAFVLITGVTIRN